MKNLIIEELNFYKLRKLAEPTTWTVKSNYRKENRTARENKAARYVPKSI